MQRKQGAGPGLRLVEIHRPKLEPKYPRHTGYLIEANADVVLMQVVDDEYRLDGYRAFARGTVDEICDEVARRAVIETALRLKNAAPRAPKSIDTSSMYRLVMSVNAAYELVVLHRERVDPDVCEVGRLRLATAKTYVLDEMSPDARWDDDATRFRFADVTRVEFDGEYENTLSRVAAAWGHPRPRLASQPRTRTPPRTKA